MTNPLARKISYETHYRSNFFAGKSRALPYASIGMKGIMLQSYYQPTTDQIDSNVHASVVTAQTLGTVTTIQPMDSRMLPAEEGCLGTPVKQETLKSDLEKPVPYPQGWWLEVSLGIPD